MLSSFCSNLMLGRSLKELTPKQLGDEDEIDEDVRAEADRVVGGGADEDVVKVRRLCNVACSSCLVFASSTLLLW